MKKFLAFAIGFLVLLAVSDVKAQTGPMLPTANKIIYSTNAVEIQDSVTKLAYNFKKGTLLVRTKGTGTGATASIVETHVFRQVWAGPVSLLRIVGVTNTDSLKVVSLKTTPY